MKPICVILLSCLMTSLYCQETPEKKADTSQLLEAAIEYSDMLGFFALTDSDPAWVSFCTQQKTILDGLIQNQKLSEADGKMAEISRAFHIMQAKFTLRLLLKGAREESIYLGREALGTLMFFEVLLDSTQKWNDRETLRSALEATRFMNNLTKGDFMMQKYIAIQVAYLSYKRALRLNKLGLEKDEKLFLRYQKIKNTIVQAKEIGKASRCFDELGKLVPKLEAANELYVLYKESIRLLK